MTRAARWIPAGVAALVFAGCSVEPPPKPRPVGNEPIVAPVYPPATHPGLTIAAVGDVMLGTDYPENTLPDDDGVSFLDNVAPILSGPDVAFGNLEGVLEDGGTPVKQCKNPKVCFLFRTPARYAHYLRIAGFDAMSLANNHARDFGEDGRSASMAALDEVGIHHSGREGTSASWVANGRRIALVAFTPNVGSNLLNEPEQARQLVADLAAKNDIVIVSFHGGAEGNGAEVLPFAREVFAGEDRGDVVAFGHAMVDAGADLVLGSGPHVLRAMELYKDRLIAYSLGNFATYYGISVEGNRGIAGVLLATLADDGRFVSGRFESTIQIRPAGPSIDPDKSALKLLQSLTIASFPDGPLAIADDGTLSVRAAR